MDDPPAKSALDPTDLPRGTPGTKRQSSPIAKISSQLDLHHYNHNLNSVLDVFVFQRRKGMRARLTVEEMYESRFTNRRDQASQTYVPITDPGTDGESIEVELSQRIKILEAELKRHVDGLNDKSFLSRESSVYTALAKSHAQLEGYKKQLQNDVAIMRYGQGTRHVESYYEKKMHDLYAEIRLLARRIMPLREELTPELFESFKIALSGFPEGKETVKVMSSSGAGDCYALFCRNRSRGNMFMHLLSLTLYRRVLTPFAFGLDEVVTDTLHELQEIILDQEIEFGKVLTVRQSLGEASFKLAARRKRQTQEQVSNSLISVLSTLNPTTQSQKRFDEREIHALVQKAVDLRDDLTREHGIYVWNWLQAACDSEVENSNRFDVEGEAGDDVFPLCIFPGLSRKFRNVWGSIEEVVVTQGIVEMERIPQLG